MNRSKLSAIPVTSTYIVLATTNGFWQCLFCTHLYDTIFSFSCPSSLTSETIQGKSLLFYWYYATILLGLKLFSCHFTSKPLNEKNYFRCCLNHFKVLKGSCQTVNNNSLWFNHSFVSVCSHNCKINYQQVDIECEVLSILSSSNQDWGRSYIRNLQYFFERLNEEIDLRCS